MSWNYRIVRKNNDRFGEETYQIHECYYWPDQSVRFVSSRGIDPWGESFDELKENMHQMAEAFHRPVVEWRDEWNDE